MLICYKNCEFINQNKNCLESLVCLSLLYVVRPVYGGQVQSNTHLYRFSTNIFREINYFKF